jgi:hypothetical protein
MSETPRAAAHDSSGPSPALDLLAAGIPLTLLLDLALPEGPDSAYIYRSELVGAGARVAS